MDSSLRPRDIQTRIRAGESPEDVAAVAGTALEKVMVYASPVLAERAHVAEQALRASLRRRGPASAEQPRTLGPATAQRLRDQGVDPESVAWDAWRREDGRWALQAAYVHEGAERSADFNFDARGNYVSAENPEGRWLIGEEERVTTTPTPPATGLRLAPDPARHSSGEDTVDLGGAPETADADWMASPREPMLFDQERTETDDPEPVEAAEAAQTPRRAPRKSRGRAQVPSWDEIMFGNSAAGSGAAGSGTAGSGSGD